MPQTRFTLQPAYVLHGRPYRESSLLLEALTREFGRVGLVARGARSPRSRWKNLLQPFRPLLLSWVQRGELGTLSGADQVASPPPLSGESLFCGLYANELTVRFLQRSDPHPGLFEHYRSLLTRLVSGSGPQPALRIFEKHLLESTGFGLQLHLEYETRCPVDPEVWYVYTPELGPVRQETGRVDDGALISGSALLALESGQIEEKHLKELKQLMRRVIRHHLGDRPIASQSLFS